MNTDEQDGAIIEIEDDVWDAVGAMIALICEFNGEPYFDAEGTDLKEESMHGIDCLEQTESNSTIMDAERNNLRAITKNIVSSIVQEISKTFSKPDCQNSPEAHEALTTDASTAPESISRDEADSNGRLEIKYADVCIAPSSKVQVPQGILLSSQDNNDMSLIELKHESQDELNCFPSKLQFSADHENLSVPSVGAESKVPSFLAQLASDDNGQVNTDINGDSKASDPLNYSTNQMHLRVPLSSTGTELKKSVGVTNHMRFYCENESTIEQNSVAMISSLLDFVTGSKKEKYMQNQLSHADFCKIAVAVRFSYYDSEQKCAPLFEKLSLLHILCIQRNVFDETVYDELVCAGCTPEVEMSTGCNVFAFAATRGNFKAMHYITMKHSSILKTALYSCHDADRNLLNCIMEHAAPSDFDSLLEYLGPSVCSELCTNFKDVGVSQVFVALKSGNYAFLQSISKQVYLWNITAADLGDQQTFLSAMMTNPNAHGTLLKMISNITSLESFVIQSTEGIRDASMMLQTFQAGHTQIVSHVIRQQHNLYFSEWDKSDAASKIDARMTKSQLTAFLSSLLGKNQSNTVALWHCIHLVTSLSHDEEMALDLLSTANLDAVKHHHHWRSFDRFNGESALHIAAQKDWKEIVSCLCDLGHDFNPFCFMMRTPMYVSALHNSLKSLKLLNNVGADASIENGDGKSPIMCSIETKNTECSMEILSNLSSRKSLFRTDSKGLSPLMRALQSKQLQVAHAILKKYPEQANFVTINGNNIFHAAAPHLASVQQLVSWSSQERKDIRGFLQQKNNDGETPKDICAHCGYLDSLRFFLQIHQSKGSINSSKSLQNIDVHISESVDAFSRINFSSTTSIQKFLSKHIESINCHDFYHRTPFILAVQAKNLQGARDLVDAGVDILKTDDLGNCAMHYMFLLNREQALWMWEEPTTSDTDPSDMLQCIIQRNSEDSVAKCLTLKNKAGITPFCMAVMNEFYVDVALLCGELKFPKHLLNVQLPNGTYCLHIACAKNLINLAMLFLSLGSDPSVLNSDGMSPEYIARTHRHNSIILILMQFCNALRIQCAIRSYLSRIHALAHRADCISVQNSVFKLIDNTNTALQQYIDLRGNFPRANWNSIEHPKHPDIVPMAHAAMSDCFDKKNSRSLVILPPMQVQQHSSIEIHSRSKVGSKCSRQGFWIQPTGISDRERVMILFVQKCYFLILFVVQQTALNCFYPLPPT
jgi:ankyrin repeat protein